MGGVVAVTPSSPVVADVEVGGMVWFCAGVGVDSSVVPSSVNPSECVWLVWFRTGTVVVGSATLPVGVVEVGWEED